MASYPTKLTAEQVREILISLESPKDLSERFSISKEAVHQIRKRRIWKHIDVANDELPNYKDNRRCDATIIRSIFLDPRDNKTVAAAHNISKVYVNAIWRAARHADLTKSLVAPDRASGCYGRAGRPKRKV